MKITRVNIKKTDIESGKLLARASVVLNDCIEINEIKILNGSKGIYIAMPSYKYDEAYHNIVQPNNELMQELANEIIAAYIGG